MIRLSINDYECLQITDLDECLRGAHASQLAVWDFLKQGPECIFVCKAHDLYTILNKVVRYLKKHSFDYIVDASLQPVIEECEKKSRSLSDSQRVGASVKEGNISSIQVVPPFLNFLQENLHRKLKPHQVKAAIHLLCVRNGANFSVPGSGKTAVVLSVFQWLRQQGKVDALLIVGPLACFRPWRYEYKATLGVEPSCEILAGGDINRRHAKYYVTGSDVADLYLTSFHTMSRDVEKNKILLDQSNVRFFVVLDEAHYIKKIGGMWATSLLKIAPYAAVRCVLTGTPFPHSYTDAFNLFDFLWPGMPPISRTSRIKIKHHVEQGESKEAVDILDSKIASLFYRVRKRDLGLAKQDFQAPILVEMKPHEQYVYNTIMDKIKAKSKEEFIRDWDLAQRLRRGRIVRLRQAISYIGLLNSAITDYDEDLIGEDISLAERIRGYDKLEELSGKMSCLLSLLEDLLSKGEKVVIWSNFVGTLKKIKHHCLASFGKKADLIYGGVPTEESKSLDEERTRERIIDQFVDKNSGLDILIANPAACAESVSLHKTCFHAIYYDLSYNCAQFLQSLDRIHRVGGSEERVAHYHFLQYIDTIDCDIQENLRRKERDMSVIVDKDYPVYSSDMREEDDELAAYERLIK